MLRGAWRVRGTVMDCQKGRTFGAVVVLLQGLVTALFPRMSIRFITNAIGKNFDNAAELEAKPAYRRQLRALGVGTVAAAGTGLFLQSGEETDDEPTDTGTVDETRSVSFAHQHAQRSSSGSSRPVARSEKQQRCSPNQASNALVAPSGIAYGDGNDRSEPPSRHDPNAVQRRGLATVAITHRSAVDWRRGHSRCRYADDSRDPRSPFRRAT